jgi:hypothetical protein
VLTAILILPLFAAKMIFPPKETGLNSSENLSRESRIINSVLSSLAEDSTTRISSLGAALSLDYCYY